LRKIKRKIEDLLRRGDEARAFDALSGFPPRRAVNPLFSLLLSTEGRVKWFAVRALGEITADMASNDPEGARVILRRLLWQLNDESGGIGWGCPEAMGEILARNRALAEEFAPILLSYLREDGNFLEYDPLRRGAVWGVGRLARGHPDLARDAEAPLTTLLESSDPHLRGLAAWALGHVGAEGAAKGRLRTLCSDRRSVAIFEDGVLSERTVGDLARQALERVEQSPDG